MQPLSSPMQTIAAFAEASDALTGWAASLKARGFDATTRADVFMHVDGPKLQRWVEVTRGEETLLAWGLEMGTYFGEALISAQVYWPDMESWSSLGARRAREIGDIKEALDAAIAWLLGHGFEAPGDGDDAPPDAG